MQKYRHSTDMHDSADIHRNNTELIEYNTNLRLQKNIYILYTEIEI